MKPEARIIAWDDFAFDFFDSRVTVVGTVFRGGKSLDGVISTKIWKDGMDATEKIALAIRQSRHFDQLSYIMLDGITYGGLNTVDIKTLNDTTGLPVLVIMRRMPDITGFITAMRKLGNYERRLIAVSNAGNIYRYRDIFYQKTGMNREEAEDVLCATISGSNIPEPLRVAHLISSGLSRKRGEFFESKGGA